MTSAADLRHILKLLRKIASGSKGFVVLIATVKLVTIGMLIYSTSGCAHCRSDRETVYQVSTIDALLNACYDGSVSIADLKRHGDTGIGTFDRVDGEMIALDGAFYRIKSDGTISPAEKNDTSPFCAVTFFECDRKTDISPGTKLSQLSHDMLGGSQNYFYALKITGKFKAVKARSVPKQSRPYPMLLEVSKTQPVFNYSDIEGTAVGFYCPQYVKGINVPGFHLHFLSADKKCGGHILDFEIEKASMQIDETTGFRMQLPQSEDFGKLDLTKDKEKELNKVEK